MSSARSGSWRSGSLARAALAVASLLLLPPAAGLAQGKGQGVEVRAASARLLEARPGQIINLSFRVTNGTDREQEFLESLAVPPNWQTIIPLGNFVLQPRESTARVAALLIPRTAAAARYEIAYSVRGQRDPGVRDEDRVTVAVAAVTKLALLFEGKPDRVAAGEAYEAKLRVANQGNTAAKVRLEARSDNSYPARVEPSELELAGAGTGAAVIRVQTRKGAERPFVHTVQVTARSGEVSVSDTLTVEVIPEGTRRFDPYHRIPAELTLRASGGRDATGLQAELRGAGALHETGPGRVEFLLRGPSTDQAGVFGLRDEYRLSYGDGKLALGLGDQTYGLSRLTDYFRYGRGLGVSLGQSDGAEVGAYYVRSRWEQPATEEFAAYAGSRVTRNVGLRLNLLRRTGAPAAPGLPGAETLWSLEGTVRPSSDMNLSLEYGRSDASGARPLHDDAYRIEGDGRAGTRGQWSFSKIHAGPEYGGYYRDCDYTSGAASFGLTRRLDTHLAYQMWQQNLEQRLDRLTAPRENLLQVGLDYHLPAGAYASLEYGRLGHRDLAMASAPDVREQAVTLGLGASSSRYSVRGDVRLGRRNDAATAERRAVTQCTVYASYRPTRANAFTLYAGSGSGGVASSRLLPGGNNLGVAALWTLSKQTRLDLAYLRYGGVNGGQFDLRFSYGQRRDRPSWELQVRRSESGLGGQSETAYVISYTRPFGVPVGKKRSLGGIAGTVYDAQDPDRRGLPGVVLRANGALVTTDPRGRFAFPDLAPGAYPVTASLEAAGLSRVSVTKLPLIVEVKPGESAAIEIAVTEGARLSGTVTVGRATPAPGQENGYVIGGPEGENAPAVGAGLRDIVVELSQGDEVLRRATDASGRFLFADLRPGRWHLKVYDWNLPAFHQVENAERDPELKPGESQELRINVTPRRRRIRLMESESGVTVPEPAATSAPSR